MKLSENLKRIRKENNLSQEQLAEKLGVSRQAVSKWESGQSYPEMDKVIQICKTFNFNMDELMNENVKEVRENKQATSNVNKTIEDFFDFITKTVDMFSAMKFMQKIKCIFEQFVIGCILFVVMAFGLLILKEITYGVLGFLPGRLFDGIRNILQSIYLCAATVFSLAIILHVFKVRYLDYYEVIKTEEKVPLNKKLENENTDVNVIEEQKEIVETKDNKKVFLEKKKEKIVIRDPKHSHSKFLNGIFKFVMWCIKFAVACFAALFVMSFVGLIALLVLSFVFTKTGLVFVGTLLTLVAAIIINFIILQGLYNFIVSKKSHKSRMAMLFLISLVLIGVGVSTFMIGATKFDYTKEIEEKDIIKDTYYVEMRDDLVIMPWEYSPLDEIEYIEVDSGDVLIEVEHSKFHKTSTSDVDNILRIYAFSDEERYMETLRDIIDDINNRKIRDIQYFADTKIYASKENIEKLKLNRENYKEVQKVDELNEAYEEIGRLKDEIKTISSERYSVESIISEKDAEISNLEYVIQEKYSEISNLQEELAAKEQENIILQEKLANIANEAN